MRIALVGTRGVPARYGGFETAVEEVGKRLVARGHDVTVYCRRQPGSADAPADSYLGMRLVHLPAMHRKSLETLSHTALSVLHLVRHGRADAAIVFNAANSVFLPLLRLRRLPTATHVDGLEWRRAKWGRIGQRYYRTAEALSVRWSDALIADARGIGDYYTEEFGAETVEIAYGAPVLDDPGAAKLAQLDLQPGGYHLVVARFEPENHVDVAIDGYLRSHARRPLVVVGSAPYPGVHQRSIDELASRHDGVRLLGGIWDQEQLDQLYANALTYVHGHSVGGTNPSLLRAMGAGSAVLAYDVNFNRDVLGPEGRFFADSAELGRLLDEAEAAPEDAELAGKRLAERAGAVYTWDAVAAAYEDLCRSLVNGRSQRGRYSGRRSAGSSWRSER
jgi:glycosyltransferase involved in cell wall biosynthesis